jgi:hypothetical protein
MCLKNAALAIAVMSLFGAGTAAGKEPCPEGRMRDGTCVKPRLADSNRAIATALSQPKISYTAPPVLPSEDRYVPASPSTHEMLNLFGYPPVTSAITTGTAVRSTFQIFRP